MTCLVITGLVLIALACFAALAVLAFRPLANERQRATDRPTSRHRAGQVDQVATDYMPPIGQRRIENLTETQRLELPE